jgi:hypothetical protein
MEPFHSPALRHGFVLDSLTSTIDCLCFDLPLSTFFSGFQVFPDGIYPAGGKSEIEGIFPPPYFEWFQFNKVIGSDITQAAISNSHNPLAF